MEQVVIENIDKKYIAKRELSPGGQLTSIYDKY